MEKDVEMMADLGLKAYRFSVSWPRVLPQGIGDVNEAGMHFYERLVDMLLEQDVYKRQASMHMSHGTTTLLPTTLSYGMDSIEEAIRHAREAGDKPDMPKMCIRDRSTEKH